MHGKLLVTCLWPGLSQLWIRGQWAGLLLAAACAALLNLALAVTLVWTQWWEPRAVLAIWIVLAGIWAAGAVGSLAWLRGQTLGEEREDRFPNAIAYYLKGDLYQAELVARQLLRQNERDVEARLLLATLLRQSRRLEEAAGELDILTRLEGSEKWTLEIESERVRIQRHRERSGGNNQDSPNVTTPTEKSRAA